MLIVQLIAIVHQELAGCLQVPLVFAYLHVLTLLMLVKIMVNAVAVFAKLYRVNLKVFVRVEMLAMVLIVPIMMNAKVNIVIFQPVLHLAHAKLQYLQLVQV